MNKILVIRNDKIGDFMLAWPAFAMLKQSMPECHITALVPGYTKALAELCPWIDDVIIDPGKHADKAAYSVLLTQIKQARFDASINFFSTTYSALLVWRAGIKYRLAPATKIAQIFYNKRVKQKRSQSAKPEYEYNLDLVRAFLSDIQVSVAEPSAPYLSFTPKETESQRNKLASELSLDGGKPWIFLHAGSGGSANNLSVEQYASLVSQADLSGEIVLTAGPGEEDIARQLKSALEGRGIAAVVYDKNDGLVDFACSLSCADLFIAGSTGPLHIAAALDVKTVGFFPGKRSATPLRWRPLNSELRHLAFCPPQAADKAAQEDMSRIDTERCAAEINAWFNGSVCR